MNHYRSKSVLVVATLAILLVSGLLIWQSTPAPKKVAPVSQTTATATAEKSTLAHSLPVHIRIPKPSIDANIVELGLQQSGELEVLKEYSDVGWYKYGPSSGEVGAAVMAGHLDSPTAPAVFYHLDQLQSGDTIEISRQDATTAKFVVYSTEVFPQDHFPTQKVYENPGQAEIRLITCNGVFNRADHRYNQNLVVFGRVLR